MYIYIVFTYLKFTSIYVHNIKDLNIQFIMDDNNYCPFELPSFKKKIGECKRVIELESLNLW